MDVTYKSAIPQIGRSHTLRGTGSLKTTAGTKPAASAA